MSDKKKRSMAGLPWIAAMAFFMQALDATILNTALPAIAHSLNRSPLAMQSAIISYTLTVAMLIPVSGWLADRFGTRRIFTLAVSLFTTAPVELYKLCVSLQGSFTAGITGFGESFGTVASEIIASLKDAGNWQDAAASGPFGGLSAITSPILMIFILIMMGYAVIKVFFANLKRGGILLIQIAVGSLYMFSVPRGYIDGFIGWCKQVTALCLTTFLQATILIAGLMVLKDRALLGLGLMLAAGEIPRIAGQFGLDTGTRANVMSAVYAAQSAVNLTRTVVQTVAK